MKKTRRTCFPTCFLIALATICLGGLLTGLAAYEVTNRAERAFGPPAANLDYLQRLYLSAFILLQANDLSFPNNAYGKGQAFQVALGETPSSIAGRMQVQGLISNADAFRNYLIYTGLDTTLQAGQYQIPANLSPVEIANLLQDATPSEVSFRILPGWRLEEVVAALPTSGLEIRPEIFLAAARSRPAGFDFLADLPSGASLEGFLFPDTYILQRTTSADELVAALLTGFADHVDDDIRQGFSRQNLTVYQAVILASIVEREAVVEEEMPIIASVFLNRLASGMKLESDPTVQYALGFVAAQSTWWKNPLSLRDLKFDSPYNTYIHPGLPPSPIANPGLSALKAVAFPAQTPYFFFRAACDDSGRHRFAESFEAHIENACP